MERAEAPPSGVPPVLPMDALLTSEGEEDIIIVSLLRKILEEA